MICSTSSRGGTSGKTLPIERRIRIAESTSRGRVPVVFISATDDKFRFLREVGNQTNKAYVKIAILSLHEPLTIARTCAVSVPGRSPQAGIDSQRSTEL